MCSHCLHDAVRLPDCSSQFKIDGGMCLAQCLKEFRQVFLEVAALGDEHRNDNNALKTLHDQHLGTLGKIRFNKLKECQLNAHFRRTNQDRRSNPSHRRSPLRVACTVPEQDQSSFTHSFIANGNRTNGL